MGQSILFDIMTLAQTSIANRGLSGITGDNVILQKRPAARARDLPAQQFPCVILAPWGAEDLETIAGMNTRDDIVYPIVVAVVANDQWKQKDNFDTYLYWRQSIRQLFHEQALPKNDGTIVNGTTYNASKLAWQIFVRPLEIVDREAWDKLGNFVSGMILMCKSREPRG